MRKAQDWLLDQGDGLWAIPEKNPSRVIERVEDIDFPGILRKRYAEVLGAN